MKKAKWFVLFFAFFALLGYCREFFFVHLNILMFEKYHNRPSAVAPAEIMNVFRNYSYDTLYYSKYLYTLISVVLFFSANYLAVKLLTDTRFLAKLVVYTYFVIVGFAALSMLYGYFINGRLQDDEYTLSRWLMGIAQSPIICLILVASEKLYNKSLQS
ncbi:hypothetical protein CNR22_07130 [Sphingobacteriaceae bacterium]|nr:hypothetical protein CNR22_07130 [Sphingobacteriaceae bacterium]